MEDIDLKYIKRLGKGDHEAFDILFIQYHSKLKRFFLGFIKDEEVANDMIQDIFLKIWINKEAVSKAVSFNRYLFRMAKNMIYDYFDHELIREKFEQNIQDDSDYLYADILEEEIYANELSLLFDIAIDKMPPQRKQIFILSRKKGVSNEEIAEKLNINIRTVENHITLAIRELRKIIQSSLFFFN